MQKAASLADVPEHRGFKVEIAGEKILLVRDGAEVRAYAAVCPHAGAPLEEGAVCDGRIVCPWHKGAFRVADGGLAEPPALVGLSRYPVRVEHDDVWVEPRAVAAPRPVPPHDERVFVLIGAGAAGAAAASALREYGFGGRVLLIGREPEPPYDRTTLSKFVLAGEMRPQEIPPLLPDDFYRERRVERIEAEANRLDAPAREVELANGRRVRFDRALIATGGAPKRPDLPGADLPGAHVLRSRADAEAALADLRPQARAVVLGSSFIGLEAAACLRAQKVATTVVTPEETPFAHSLGARVGAAIQALHRRNGVEFCPGAEAARIEGASRVEAVVLKDGRRLPADLVVIGVGVRPATDFVQGLRLAEDGGLPVDAAMRAEEGVYAAGDVAAFPLGDAGRTRVEHWRVAQQQARVAAANMAGRPAVYDGVPFFWTYHYGRNVEYLGHAERWDEEVVIGEPERLNFVAFLLQGERVAAVVACQRQRLTAALAERMRRPLTRAEAERMAQAPEWA